MSAEAAPAVADEQQGHQAFRRRLIGTVIKDAMNKTVVVAAVRYKMDPLYKKYVKVRKKYKAHDEKNEYKVGDRVEIMENRPISKQKRWRVSKLIERPAAEIAEEAQE